MIWIVIIALSLKREGVEDERNKQRTGRVSG